MDSTLLWHLNPPPRRHLVFRSLFSRLPTGHLVTGVEKSNTVSPFSFPFFLTLKEGPWMGEWTSPHSECCVLVHRSTVDDVGRQESLLTTPMSYRFSDPCWPGLSFIGIQGQVTPHYRVERREVGSIPIRPPHPSGTYRLEDSRPRSDWGADEGRPSCIWGGSLPGR